MNKNISIFNLWKLIKKINVVIVGYIIFKFCLKSFLFIKLLVIIDIKLIEIVLDVMVILR